MDIVSLKEKAKERSTELGLYWIHEMCLQHTESTWLLSHSAYFATLGIVPSRFVETNRGVHEIVPGFFVTDSEKRGFMLVMPMSDQPNGWFELYYAFVDPSHRYKGVLRSMVERLKEQLSQQRSVIWLECKPDLLPCWRSLGFVSSAPGVQIPPVYIDEDYTGLCFVVEPEKNNI